MCWHNIKQYIIYTDRYVPTFDAEDVCTQLDKLTRELQVVIKIVASVFGGDVTSVADRGFDDACNIDSRHIIK